MNVTAATWNTSASPEEHPWGAFVLSALGHGLLMTALIWGVHISSEAPAAVEAEMWSSLPQLAAPQAPEATVIPPPATRAIPLVEPNTSPEIVTEKLRPVTKKVEPKKADLPKLDPPQAADKVVELKKQQEHIRKKAEAERLRNEQFAKDVQSMLAGAGGTGAAPVSASPKGDAGWVARTAARIRANTIFSADTVAGNPVLEYAVDLDPAGGVLAIRKLRSSGLPGFDEAVERAIRKSEPFAADASGKVPRNFVIQHRLKD